MVFNVEHIDFVYALWKIFFFFISLDVCNTITGSSYNNSKKGGQQKISFFSLIQIIGYVVYVIIYAK